MMTLPKTTQKGVGEGRLELRSVWLHSPRCLHNNEGWLMLGVHGGMGCGAGQEGTPVESSAKAPQVDGTEQGGKG